MSRLNLKSKFSPHTLLTFALLGVFVLVVLINRNLMLIAAVAVLLVSVIGNGLIHIKTTKFTKDTFIEYVVVLLIGLLLIIGSVR